MSEKAEKRSVENGFAKVTSKRKPLRYQELYRQLDEDGFQDAFIIAWDEGEKKKLNVHKSMILAASKVLRTQLSSRWDSSEPVINLPETYSLKVAKAFVKLLYIDEIDAHLSLESVLQIASLCDMYMIEDAIYVCNDFVLEGINDLSCVQVYEAYERLQINNFKEVKTAALRKIAGILPSILFDSFVETCSESLWKGLLELECPEFCDDAEQLELQLFQKLLNWKEANPEARDKLFREELVPLIRFPVMRPETLAEKIFPTGVLSPSDITEIFCFMSQSDKAESEGNYKTRFSPYSRRQKLVTNSKDLKPLLQSCQKHDNIVLSPGIFKGAFSFQQNQIKISGSGNLATQITCYGAGGSTDNILQAKASDSLIQNLEITCSCRPSNNNFSLTGARNKISNIKTSPCTFHIHGNFNEVVDSIIEKAPVGIHICIGKFNKVHNLNISNVGTGILIDSDESIVQNINVANSGCSIGSRNSSKGNFKNISFTFDELWNGNAILISGGSQNKIRGFSCSPLLPLCSYLNTSGSGITIQGAGGETEITDFRGDSLKYGLILDGKGGNNIVHNFLSNDTTIGIAVSRGSGNNYGKGIRCEYSRRFLNSANMENIKGVKIVESCGNAFENFEIAVEIDKDEPEEKDKVTAFLNSPNLITGQDNSVQVFTSHFV